MSEKLTPEQLLELEGKHTDEVTHLIEERRQSIKALEADIHRIEDEQAIRDGTKLKELQAENERIEGLSDQEFEEYNAELLAEARKKELETLKLSG